MDKTTSTGMQIKKAQRSFLDQAGNIIVSPKNVTNQTFYFSANKIPISTQQFFKLEAGERLQRLL